MTKSILIDIAVAKRLKSARIRLNLSIKHISEATGFSYGMIYFSESGRNSVSTAYLSYLSSLGINVDWILTGEGHMFSRKEEETGKERPLTLLSQGSFTTGGIGRGVMETVVLSSSLLEGLVSPFLFSVEDRSMVPLISPGDRLLIDGDPKIADFPLHEERLYLVRQPEKEKVFPRYIKRLEGPLFFFYPLNIAEFEPLTLSPQESPLSKFILGRVAGLFRTFPAP